ncbi:hypothetical protein V8F06_011147 [Rhypophila decipiens]
MLLISGTKLLAVLASLSGISWATSSGTARTSFQPSLHPPGSFSRSLRSDASNNHIDKRWLAVETGTDANADHHLWPDKTVTYAFNSVGDMKANFKNLIKAIELWNATGLSREEYKWKAILRPDCLKDRTNCLLITRQDGVLKSTIAKAAAQPKHDLDGPEMFLDAGENPPTALSFELSYAHEIGHVWGLGHEHQNPAFWSREFDPNQKRKGTVFTPNNFKCEQHWGFSRALRLANDKSRADYAETDRLLLCHVAGVASKLKFGVFEYLPVTSGYYSESSALSQGPKDVDWDSIMIYPTRMNPSSPTFFFKPDGSDIPISSGPTLQDVNGIQRMYNAKPKKANFGALLNSGANKAQAQFKKMFCGCYSSE